MTKKLFAITAVLLIAALTATAADAITGKWTMEQAGRDGNTRVTTFNLKADGAKLTGTVQFPPMGPGGEAFPPAEISNGKVDGNNVSFDVTRDFGGNSMTFKYEGVASGNEMKVKMTIPNFQGGDPIVREATAKKAN